MKANRKTEYAIFAAEDAQRLIKNIDRDLAQLICLIAMVGEPRSVAKLAQRWTQMSHELNEVIHLLNRQSHTPFPKPPGDEHRPDTWAAHYAKYLSQAK
jgi:hypothetical protein